MKLFSYCRAVIFLGSCLSISQLSFAKSPYGMAGCGLGSVMMGPTDTQVSAATTNGSSSNQAFGITSGTSNCVEPGEMVNKAAQETFIQQNFATLSKEIAQGDGEALRAFAVTFGCKNESYPIFALQLQASYDEIFAAAGSIAALGVIKDEIAGNAGLASDCNIIL